MAKSAKSKEIAGRSAAGNRNSRRKPSERAKTPAVPERGLDALLEFIHQTRGFDFASYKRSTLSRRVLKRMQDVGVPAYGDYIDFLEVHPEEFGELFDTILINVTAFFRDATAWEEIRTNILPRIIAGKKAEEPIRVWSAGCSSGEEAYTLAMLLVEALGPEQFRTRVKIYGTDVDEEALNQARQASYTARQVGDIPPSLLARYFDRHEGRYVFNRELRRQVIFGRHDLLQDAPISRVDLVTCRNTLMYFNAEAQARIVQRFAFALRDGGILFLGRAETLLSRFNTFSPVDLKRRVFYKLPRSFTRDQFQAVGGGEEALVNHGSEETRLREAAQDVDLVAQISVDAKGALVIANEPARTLFNLNHADIGRPLQDLELSYRPVELRTPIEDAFKTKRPITVRDVEFSTAGAPPRYLDLTVIPLYDATGSRLGAKAIFADVTRAKQLQQELDQSQQELETAYEELQSANEELETTNEELQSTVEELETTNEELKSTNEELETMNEELQSTNAQLEASNEELGQRSDELAELNRFSDMVLTQAQEGIIAVDPDLKITAWNHRSEDLWGLRRDEVLGQHLMNLDSGLPVAQLRAAARAVLAGEIDRQQLEIEATNRRGRSVKLVVTIARMAATDRSQPGLLMTMRERKDQ